MDSPSTQDFSIKLSIDSCLEQVQMVGYAVRGICSQMGLGDIVIYQMELAVVEAVNNAIKYAYESVSGHNVEVIIAVNSEWIRFDICDEGKPFKFQQGVCFNYDPDDRKNLPEKGMGLCIMEKVMDDINYCSREGHNCMRLGKHLK